MDYTLKIILGLLLFAILTFWAYHESVKSKVWDEEMTKRFYEALKKRTENLNDDLASTYKYRDITEDAEVLLSDWERVGEDIQYAMSEMDKELADKDNEEDKK
jgi:transposase-like protein